VDPVKVAAVQADGTSRYAGPFGQAVVVGSAAADVLGPGRYPGPVGHYDRPGIFRLCVDTSPRPAVTKTPR
jgi:hypothetical protein